MRKLYGRLVPKRLFGQVRVIAKAHNGKFQAKNAEPSPTDQTVVADSGYDALSLVTVKAATLQEKTITPSSVEQTVVPDIGVYGLSKVIVKPQGNSGLLHEKTVSPTGDQQIVTPDEGYYGLSKVVVEGIPRPVETKFSLSDNVITEVSTLDTGGTASTKITLDDSGVPVLIEDGDENVTIEIAWDAQGYPTNLVINGGECPIDWEGF